MITHTDRDVVSNPAVSIDTTEARTRVLALSVDTSFVSGTVLVDLTLGPTVGRRSQHLRQTVTLAPVSHPPWRLAVWSTGIWVTRIDFDWFN